VAGGPHRLLVSRRESVGGLELRVSVPVGAPGGARNAGGSTPMVLPIPVEEADPADRLARVVAITRDAKAGRDRGYRGLLASPLVPLGLLRIGIRWLRRHGGSRVNLYVTNVSGPPRPLWLLGARLRTAVPIAPLVAGVPLAVAALSYAGDLVISFQVDDAGADLDVLVAGAAGELDGLIDGAGPRVPYSAKTAGPRPSGRWSGHRCRPRPACPGCSRPATSATGRSSGSLPRSGRAPPPSAPSTST
jgi:diacylglycerol O-acyltransferase / wax synthase